jgi:intracellular septation protein
MKTFLLGGLLPIVAFTAIEEFYGIVWGLVAGMVFGVGEIIWEWKSRGKVQGITWGANIMILVLGGASLLTQEGLWFKLQPALMEAIFALVLVGSVLLGRPLLWSLASRQLPATAPAPARLVLEKGLRGMTWRMGVFFALQAAVAAWAAVYWSTQAWALLKGVGLTVSLLGYGVVESLLLRRRLTALRAL